VQGIFNIIEQYIRQYIKRYFGKIEYFGVFLITVIFIFTHAFLVLRGFEYLYLTPIALLILILALFYQEKLMLYLAFCVPLSIPLSYFSSKIPIDMALPTEPIIILLMVLFLIKIMLEGFDRSILYHPVSLAIYFYLAWILITSVTSEMPVVSIKHFFSRFWFITVFYFLGTQLFKKYKNIIKFNWYYLAGLLIVVIISLSKLVAIGLADQHASNRVVKPFYNDHTDYAAAIAMVSIFLFGLIFIRRKASLAIKLFYLALFLFFIFALIFSYTRAAWVSLFVAIIFFIGMKLRFKLRHIFAGLGIFIGLFFIFRTDIIIALERNKQDSDKEFARHLASITNVSTDASNLERINRWACAIRMFKERPIFGWGPGTYQFQYAPFQKKSEMTIISTRHGDVGNAHSEYLGPLSESGILGSLSFLLIVLTTLATASKLYFRSKRRKVRLMALTLMIALISYYVHGIMNNFLDYDKLSALFWGFTAMIVALDVYHTPSLKS
jgi:O-antigen ligase